jgi:hypothetical protein
MSDVLFPDMKITLEEECTGLIHLVGIGFEFPIPPEQTRKLAGYIARKISAYDALAAQHAEALSELAASKHLLAELTDRKNDIEARLEGARAALRFLVEETGFEEECDENCTAQNCPLLQARAVLKERP